MAFSIEDLPNRFHKSNRGWWRWFRPSSENDARVRKNYREASTKNSAIYRIAWGNPGYEVDCSQYSGRTTTLLDLLLHELQRCGQSKACFDQSDEWATLTIDSLHTVLVFASLLCTWPHFACLEETRFLFSRRLGEAPAVSSQIVSQACVAGLCMDSTATLWPIPAIPVFLLFACWRRGFGTEETRFVGAVGQLLCLLCTAGYGENPQETWDIQRATDDKQVSQLLFLRILEGFNFSWGFQFRMFLICGNWIE